MSRLNGRLRIFFKSLPYLLTKPWRRRPVEIKRVLVVHRLLLGDTLLLAPLLKKLRQQYPAAELVITCPPLIVPLFEKRPYGVRVLPYDPRDGQSVAGILRSGPYDLGIVAGDQRYGWLGLAAGCRWLLTHAASTAAWKRWPLDETPPYPEIPGAWADAMTSLIDGPAPAPFVAADWPLPDGAPFVLPGAGNQERYVVLHPGASNPVKLWPALRWAALADWCAEQGLKPVWSGGPGEAALIAAIDPAGRYQSYAEQLDLAQICRLLRGAALLVCPDTGIAHLGRVVGVPTVALFGPGSALIHGAGRFWESAPFIAETQAAMPCRNQTRLFDSTVSWIRRCDRDLEHCINRRDGSGLGGDVACMAEISEADVKKQAITLIRGI